MKLLHSSVVLLLILATCANCSMKHYQVEIFDVIAHVKFEGSPCDIANDITKTIPSVPRGSTILNVLERANTQYPTFNGFEVALGVDDTSYTVVSINGHAPTSSCMWHVSTNPVTSTDSSLFPMSSIYVTNVGMEVTFTYKAPPVSKVKRSSVRTQKKGKLDSSLSVLYTVEGTSGCTITSPITAISLSLGHGDSALNVMETAVLQNPNYNIVIKNTFGAYYTIETIDSISTAGNCNWYPYFTPPGESMYSLTATIGNFIIPMSGGTLTIKYSQSSSNSVKFDNFKRLDITKVVIPLPPHYNPFMGYDAQIASECSGDGSCTAKDEL